MNLSSQIKKLEDETEAARADRELLRQVRALLVGPVQLEIPAGRTNTVSSLQEDVRTLTLQLDGEKATSVHWKHVAAANARDFNAALERWQGLVAALEQFDPPDAEEVGPLGLVSLLEERRAARLERLSATRTRLADAGRIGPDLDDTEITEGEAVSIVCDAADGLLEDLECARALPAALPQDVKVLDAMIADERRTTWDLSAGDRAMLKRLRELVAPAEKAAHEILSTITPSVDVPPSIGHADEEGGADVPPAVPASSSAPSRKKKAKAKEPAAALDREAAAEARFNAPVKFYGPPPWVIVRRAPSGELEYYNGAIMAEPPRAALYGPGRVDEFDRPLEQADAEEAVRRLRRNGIDCDPTAATWEPVVPEEWGLRRRARHGGEATKPKPRQARRAKKKLKGYQPIQILMFLEELITPSPDSTEDEINDARRRLNEADLSEFPPVLAHIVARALTGTIDAAEFLAFQKAWEREHHPKDAAEDALALLADEAAE